MVVGQCLVIFWSELFDRGCGFAVHDAAPQGVHAFDQGGRDEGMDKLETDAAGFFNELCVFGGFERLDQRLFIELAGRRQGVIVEFAPKHGCHPQGFLVVFWHRRYARLNGDFHALRDLQLFHAGAVPIPVLEVKLA